MRETKKRRARRSDEHVQNDIDEFNAKYPVGTTVWYYLKLPFGPVYETAIRHAAWALDCNEIVCKVRGKAGGISIRHIQLPDESRRDDLEFTDGRA